MAGFLFLPLAALALDLLVGDPPSWPHPVRLIGRILDRLEALIQPETGCPKPSDGSAPGENARPLDVGAPGKKDACLSPARKRVLGLVVTASLGLGVFGAVWGLTAIPMIGGAISLILAFWGLALGQLLREARHVAGLIRSQRLDEARLALSMLVSRETAHLDAAGLWRALAETLSENFCDAFVAPYFFLCLGGAPLLWLHKTISTMDSMWGYKTARYIDLGRAGARADDLLAFFPARIAAFALFAAGAVMERGAAQGTGIGAGSEAGGAGIGAERGTEQGAGRGTGRGVGQRVGCGIRRSWAKVAADARKTASPNAGWPMAAAAWVCQASMGGPAVYFGERFEKPTLGPEATQWNTDNFSMLLKLVIRAALGIALFFPVIFWAGRYVFVKFVCGLC